MHNNQRNGFSRQTINLGRVSYHKNSLANNTPATSTAREADMFIMKKRLKEESRERVVNPLTITFHKQGYFGTACLHLKNNTLSMPLASK